MRPNTAHVVNIKGQHITVHIISAASCMPGMRYEVMLELVTIHYTTLSYRCFKQSSTCTLMLKYL